MNDKTLRIYGASVKKELNEDIWSEFRMKDNVRKALLKIAEKFYSFTGTDLPLEDIRLVGSNASYNWTADSDIDLHLIVDFSKFSTEEEKQQVLRDSFISKKRIFNDEYEINIYGHDVELYVEDINDYNASDGVFSIQKNVWIRKPKYIEPDVNRSKVKKRVQYFMNLIDRLENYTSTAEKFETAMGIKDEIVNMRQASLSSDGNFSVGNVAFKTLRNSGYINKLFDVIRDAYSKMLSINEIQVIHLKEFKMLTEGLSEEQVSFIEDLGFQLVEEKEVKDYTIALVEMNQDISRILRTKYQLGLQKKGRSFTSYEDQHRIQMPNNIDRSVIGDVMKIVEEWVNKYGRIAIGSMNPKKTKRYESIFRRYGYKIQYHVLFDNRIMVIE